MRRLIFLTILILLFVSSWAFAEDFTVTPKGDFGNVTVMEVSGNYDAKNPDGTINAIPRQEIAKEFFKTHKDEYDFLVIYSNFDFEMLDETVSAFYTGVRNDTQGIGVEIFDNSSLYGSNGKLQGTIDMGNISNIETLPLNPKFEDALDILSHEVLHRWGAHVSFIDSTGEANTSFLGKDESHWSFLLNSDASLLYGNNWEDNENGTFTSVATRKYYSPLDLYLMGFVDKSEVPEMLLIDNPGIDPARMPEDGVIINGTAQYISIDDIIAAEGERVPSASESQKTFKTAFILITEPDTSVGYEIYGIENIRNGWVTRFSVLTDGKGLMQVASTLIDDLPENPGVLPPEVEERTLPPDINDGVTWLMNNQRIDGSWMDISQTIVRDTAETVNALNNFDIAQQNYLTGIQWLNAESSENTDYLSRKIQALTESGEDISGLINELISRQNTDGGWGSNKNYLSNPVDTSLVLKSLSGAGYSDQSVVSNAIELLKAVQNTDGGWGFVGDPSTGSGQSSNIQTTANVLSAFNEYRNGYQLEDQIDTAAAWLLAKQNIDGGFGNSPSTVYDSAVAALALRALGITTNVTNNAVNYLLGIQAEDGSWYASPYQTALAVRTVWTATVDPDLSITADDITFIPDVIQTLPTNAVVNAEIWNLGRTAIPQAKVALYDGAIAEQNKIGEQTLAFPGETSATVTFLATITDGDGHNFYIVLDPDGLIDESSEANNTAVKRLSPQPTYDLEAVGVAVSANPVDMFQDVTITSTVRNNGTVDAFNVQLKYFIDETEGPFDIATVTVDIPAGETITNKYVWTTDRVGEDLALTIEADPFETFTELSETNNTASMLITVNDATEPNLTISYEDLAFTPDPANELGNVTLSAIVKNEGLSEALDIKVNFYKGIPGIDGMLLGTQTIASLNAGENSQVSIDWLNIAESGERIIYVQVDPDNTIDELREDDNDAFEMLTILSLPDLVISTNSIVFTPAAPKEGDVVSINVTVQNAGEQTVTGVTVKAYEGGSEIDSQSIDTISGNSQAVVSFTYDTAGKPGAHEITVIVDPDNTIVERTEANNQASRTFGVQNANLWLTEPYISPNGDSIKDSTQFFFGLETPQTVKIIIVNEKGETVRTFSGIEFENTTGGNITWDGLDDEGMLVDDGDYQIQVIDGNNNILGSLLVVVDNNRSPLTDAIGTKYLLNNNLTCELPDLYSWKWFPDESGIVFKIRSDPDTPEYTAGIYTMAPDGEDILRIVPWDWSIEDYALSPGGDKIAFIHNERLSSLWVVDRDGTNLTLYDDTSDLGQNWIMHDIVWSPNGDYIFYGHGSDVMIIKADGTGKTTIDDVGDGIWKDFVKWTPDSTRVAYTQGYDNTVKVSDLSGNNESIFTVSVNRINYQGFEWLNNNRLVLIEDLWGNWQKLWLVDASGNGDHIELTDDREFNGELFIAPDRQSFAFVTYANDTAYLNISDINGNTYVLHELTVTKAYCAPSINNILWSPDGNKLSYIGSIVQLVGDIDRNCPKLSSPLVIVDMETKKETSFAVSSPLKWLSDGVSIVGMGRDSIYVFNSENGEQISLFYDGYIPTYNFKVISPLERYFTYYKSADQSSVCYDKGYRDLWAISSLLNLTADLRATKEKSAVILKGIAADLNFEGYMLEYADTKSPDVWDLIAPPSDVPVINDVFTTWIPPYEGTFYVKLTVWDKAGNTIWDRKRISWGLFSSITNLYKSLEIFSPNGDDVKDTVELYYRVLEPIHLDFNIYDEDDNLITTIQKDYTAPVDDYITWDGRDNVGNVVPDGMYKIKVFTYEFFVYVDITPPDVSILLTPLSELFQDSYSLDIFANVYGYAVDNNIKKWAVESGEGDNPQEWFVLKEGSDILVRTDENGIPYLDPPAPTTIRTYRGFGIERLINNKYRITAEDFGGNRSSQITDFYNEAIAFYVWDYMNFSMTKSTIIDRIGLHYVGGFESVREQLVSATVQYSKYEKDSDDEYIWYDAETVDYPSSGLIQIPWDSSQLEPRSQYGVRIKAVDILGNVYYSKVVALSGAFAMSFNCKELPYMNAYNVVPEEIVLLKFQAKSEEDPDYSEWTDLPEMVYDSEKGDDIPTGEFTALLPVSALRNDVEYEIRMFGIGESGEIYSSGGNKYPPVCLNLDLDVKYSEAEGCLPAPGKAELVTEIEAEFLGNAVLESLTYEIGSTTGTWDVLKEFDLLNESKGPIVIDTNDLDEGKYQVRATLVYTSGEVQSNVSDTKDLIVDRVLPDAQITYPDTSLMLCPLKYTDAEGEWYGIPVEGIAIDNNYVERYELYYGIGENPSAWLPAMTRIPGKIDPVPISGGGAVQGQIGIMDVTYLRSTAFSLKLKVVDIAGNVSCHTTGFSVDTLIEITNLTKDKSLFSPNGDGILDDVNISYEINEYATVDVKVFKLIEEDDGSLVLDSTPLRTIASGLQHSGGTENAVWDGKDDANMTVQDELYGIVVFATDSCGNTRQRKVPVEVDNTPPSVEITYPMPYDPLANIVEIEGTADDTHFLNYVLEYGEGEFPDDWLYISSFTSPVEDNILGTWNTYGLEGKWTLRLSATDTVANKSETIVTIDLGLRKDLIKDLDAAPKLFSPNNDSKLDTTNIKYEITDTCDIQIEFFNSEDALKKTYTTAASSAGTYTYTWDGKDDLGTVVPDGEYSAKLTAVLSSNPSVTQEEAITLIVDTTLPVVDIEQPEENSFHKTDVAVNGSIIDDNIVEYSITYTGDTGTELLDTAGQSREDYTFGIINEPPEGEYTLNVTAKDLGENTTEKNIVFTIDRTPPKVTLDTPEEGEYYGSDKDTINITGAIDEKNLETYSLRFGLGDSPTEWTDLLTGNVLPVDPQLFTWGVGKDDNIPDGLYTLSLYAKDRAGLEGEAKAGIIVDNTLPDALISEPQDGEYVKEPVDVKGTAFDQNLDNYMLEFSKGNCSDAFKWTGIGQSETSVQDGVLAAWRALPPDGDYCLRLTVTDKVDNTTEAKTDFKVDTYPPAPPLLSGDIENMADARLNWTQNSESDLAGYNLYRDDQKINSDLITDTSYLDQNLDEGIYAYTVKAIDLAGWESEPSNEVKLIVDLTGPDANIRSPQDNARVSGLVDIKGTAYSKDDFKEYRVYTGQGADPSTWTIIRTSPVPTPYGTLVQWDTISLGEGEIYSVKLEAEDINGNISADQISVTIDNEPPVAPVLISVSAINSDATIDWQANTESDLAGYLLYRNDQLVNVSGIVIGDLRPYLIIDTTYLDEALSDGTFEYYLYAVDDAGNISDQSNSIDVTIDTHPPQAVIVEPADGSEFEHTIFVKAESQDLDIASIQFEYKDAQAIEWISLGDAVTTGPYFIYLDPIEPGLIYGDYILRAVATDKGGQTDPSPLYITVTYADLTAPNSPIELSALIDGQDVSLTWTANTEPDFAGYNIYRDSEKLNIGLVTDTTYTDTGLADGTYTYEITAVDIYDNQSGPSNSELAKIYAPVIEQPYTPTGEGSIQISGSEAEVDSSVEIFVDSGSGPILQGAAASDAEGDFVFNVTLSPEQENRITAKVSDVSGNISRMSDEVVVVYNMAPLAPTGLTSIVDNYNVALNWDANTEPDLAGYNVYRDGEKLNESSAVTTGNAYASSEYSYAYRASMAFDLNPYTFWRTPHSNNEFNTTWWRLDLTTPELINHVEIQWYSVNFAGKDYELQAWSGYAWITLAKIERNTEKENTFDFSPPYRTDKIRLYITDTNDTSSSRQVWLSEVLITKDNLITDINYDDLNLDDGRYNYEATAVDYYGFESLPSDEAQADVGDILLPTAPLNLSATAIGSDIVLNWDLNTEPDLAGYNMYRADSGEWIRINADLITEATYTDANLINGTYTYRVTAVDNAENESLPSNEASATINITLPEPPVTLTVYPAPGGEALNALWEYTGTASGYNLYRSTISGGPYSRINSVLISEKEYLDTGLTIGVAYYYVVKAVDSVGNESIYSNEAMGILLDTDAPEKPVIFFPAIPGRPAVLYEGRTDILGSAEPEVIVELFKDSIFAGSTTVLDNDVFQSFTFNNDEGEGSLSPDAKTLAYGSNDSLWLMDVPTNDNKEIIQDGYRPLWSHDGEKLSYMFEDSNWDYRIGIYDIETGNSVPLTEDTGIYESSPTWSFDGEKIAFISTRGGNADIWVKDFVSGTFVQVTNGIYVYNPELSPDGSKIAYFQNDTLYVTDIAGDNPVEVDMQTDGYSLDWSPDSRRLAFISNRNGNDDIFVYDVETLSPTQITSNTGNESDTNPLWSPDGGSIVFMSQESNWTYSIRIINTLSMSDRILRQNLNDPESLVWTGSGKIAYIQNNSLSIVELKGWFGFNDVSLDPGDNTFYALAVDASGNISIPSDEILVTFDASGTPDLVVTEDDIYIYPVYPLTGEQAAVNVVVRNTGGSEAENVDADIYIWDSSGGLELVKSVIIPYIGQGSSETISFAWDTTGRLGTNTVIVVVDPEDRISEQSETNNYADRDFVVVEDEGVSMTTTIDSSEYNSNQDVNINIDLINSGIERDIELEIKVEDVNGYEVTSFDTISTNLPYGATENYSLVWNTGATYSGPYKVHAVLRNPPEILDEDIIPFQILADYAVGLTMATDKASYDANEDVTVSFNVTNNGTNYIIPELTAEVRIIDSGSNEKFTDIKTLINILPGAASSLESIWNTGLNVPGDYTAIVNINIDGQLITSESAPFSINESIVITGSITATPSVVSLGNNVKADYSVQNNGNADVSGLVLRVIVTDPATQAVMDTFEDTIDLAMGSVQTGEFTIPTTGFGLQTYSLSLKYVYAGETRSISGTSFTVIDGTPPVVTILSPVTGSYHNALINIAALATDNASGIEKVEYKLDDGSWELLPVADPSTGRCSTDWMPDMPDEGIHTISFRATDRAGNTSDPVSTEVTVDKTPPVIQVSGVEDGQFYNSDVTPVVSITDANPDTEAITLNGGVFVSGTTVTSDGQYTLNVTATDKAGNTSTLTINFTIDKTPPEPPIIISPPDGSIVDTEAVDIIGQAEPGSTVEMGFINIFTTQADPVTGEFIFNAVILIPGENIFIFTATDNVGNESEQNRYTLTLSVGELVLTKSVHTETRTLIWIDDKIDSDDDGDDDDNCNHHHESTVSGTREFIENALEDMGGMYKTVTDEDDFEFELRSGIYNTYIIADSHSAKRHCHHHGHHHRSIHPKLQKELREAVYRGEGLVFVKTSPSELSSLKEALGVKFKGVNRNNDTAIITLDTEITDSGLINFEGDSVKVETITASTIGYFEESSLPAITANDFGAGKTVLFVFNPVDITEDILMTEIFKNSLNYVLPEEYKQNPLNVLEVLIKVEAVHADFDIKIEEIVPPEVEMLGISEGGILEGDTLTWQEYLEADTSSTFSYLIRLPDIEGTYTLETILLNFVNDSYSVYDTEELTLYVERDSSNMAINIIDLLDDLNAHGHDRARINKAIKYIRKILQRNVRTSRDAERNIHDAINAAYNLGRVQSLDVSSIRIEVDELLKIWEVKWYQLKT